MDKSEYSEDPYQDGTVPADADFATSSSDRAAAEEESADTTSGSTDPEALVRGNRVATAEDME